MRTENIYCDYCGKLTTSENFLKEKLNGFCIEIGYSKGGWGSRTDFVPKQSVEICDECFGKVGIKSNEFLNLIRSLKLK